MYFGFALGWEVVVNVGEMSYLSEAGERLIDLFPCSADFRRGRDKVGKLNSGEIVEKSFTMSAIVGMGAIYTKLGVEGLIQGNYIVAGLSLGGVLGVGWLLRQGYLKYLVDF